jgi:predicted enzyme related to lactoylglutathione lyase
MSEGIKIVIYPASDLARAKAAFSAVLGTAPDMDEPYYVQFNVNGQAIGLDPHGHKSGAVVYFHVSDIKGTLQTLLEGGAQVDQGFGESDKHPADPAREYNAAAQARSITGLIGELGLGQVVLAG